MFSLKVMQTVQKEDEIKKSKSPELIKKIPDPSPKTMKRVKSRDNFIKFQWPWIL